MRPIQDLGEMLEDQAGDDPVTTECWECRGRGRTYYVSIGKKDTCRRCHGRGVLATAEL